MNKDKATKPDPDDEPVSLAPLSPQEALRALLATPQSADDENPPQE
jgi:hypothetical protein